MKKLRHVGFEAHRLNHPSGDLERAFAEQWRKENEPPSFLNGGIGILDYLIQPTVEGCLYGEATENEESVAATVIQWLGTNCGFCFLREVLERCGYIITERKAEERFKRFSYEAGADAMKKAIIDAIQREQAWVDVRHIQKIEVPAFGVKREPKVREISL